MQYIFVAMWLIIGLVLIISVARENKVFIFAGIYFILLGIWWLLNIIFEGIMFEGTLGIAFKAVSAAVLIILLIYFLRHRKDEDLLKTEKTNNEDTEGK